MTTITILAVLSPIILIALVAAAGVLAIKLGLLIAKAVFWLAIGGLIGLALWAGEAKADWSMQCVNSINGLEYNVAYSGAILSFIAPNQPIERFERALDSNDIVWTPKIVFGDGTQLEASAAQPAHVTARDITGKIVAYNHCTLLRTW